MTEYFTALQGGPIANLAPLERFELDGSIALVHDIMAGPLPAEYEPCDLLYAEPPWRAGFETFNQRAGVDPGRTFPAFMASVSRLTQDARPVVIISGRRDAKLLPEPSQTLLTLHNGAPALALVYGVRWLLNEPHDTIALLEWLAARYTHVGDFCCGFGRAGRLFHHAGKRFTMSDFNAACIAYIAAHAGSWT